MTREDVIRMARRAGAVFPGDGSYHTFERTIDLEHFAFLVAEAEQEACARACESLEEQCEKLGLPDEKWPTPADCAFVIRARSKA
jgi:hypothetical protein